MVKLYAFTVIIQPSTSTYQFFPFRVMSACGSIILDLHHSTTSSVSRDKFLLIRSTPISVVCIFSMLSSNSIYSLSLCLSFLLISRNTPERMKNATASVLLCVNTLIIPSIKNRYKNNVISKSRYLFIILLASYLRICTILYCVYKLIVINYILTHYLQNCTY